VEDVPPGCVFAPTVVTVVEVPADEGFWAETATGLAVWVQLVGVGESPSQVVAGARLIIEGVIADPVAVRPSTGPLADDSHHVQVGFDQIATA